MYNSDVCAQTRTISNVQYQIQHHCVLTNTLLLSQRRVVDMSCFFSTEIFKDRRENRWREGSLSCSLYGKNDAAAIFMGWYQLLKLRFYMPRRATEYDDLLPWEKERCRIKERRGDACVGFRGLLYCLTVKWLTGAWDEKKKNMVV